MYSKLADVKLTVDGLEQTYTDITSKYDAVSGKYTDLDAKVAEYKSGVDGMSQNLSRVQTNLRDNYSTTATMNATIQAKIDGLSSTISQTYATGSDVQQKLASADATAKGYADAAKQAAVDTAQASAKELLKSYATVTQTQSMIDQKAGIFGGSNSISTGDGTIYIYRPDVRHGYSSEDIFNLLTNNGNIQGMYMTDGKLYWNGTYIKSKSITTAALAADSVTAEKIKVDDLYSLKASIAGFKISSDTISHQSITNPESGIGQNYYDTFFSSKDKRLTFRKGPGTSDYITFDIRGLRASGGKRLNLISDAETNDSSEGFSSGAHHSMGHTNIYGNLYVADSFRTAGTKQAVRQTENYGEKGVYCYETPTPHFGDIGSGEISEDGKCYIDIEDILKEMINTEMQYYVFLQKCGEGDLYVSECFPDYFIVTGTPGLRFFWELKAKQKGYEYNRYEGEDRVVGFRKIAYDEEYIAETEKLIEEREEI